MITRWIIQTTQRRLTGNYLSIWLIIHVNLKKKRQTFAVSSLLNLNICCFSFTFMFVNEESLGFGLLVGQKKQSKDGTCHIFFTFRLINWLIMNIIDRLNNNENNLYLLLSNKLYIQPADQ